MTLWTARRWACEERSEAETWTSRTAADRPPDRPPPSIFFPTSSSEMSLFPSFQSSFEAVSLCAECVLPCGNGCLTTALLIHHDSSRSRSITL